MEVDELLEQITNFSNEHEDLWFLFEYHIEHGKTKDFEITVFGLDGNRKVALELKRFLGIRQMKRVHYTSSFTWTTKLGKVDLRFYRAEVCKIIGYDTKLVPEHEEKTPIYECPKANAK